MFTISLQSVWHRSEGASVCYVAILNGHVVTFSRSFPQGHLDERLRQETGLPVRVADDPLACVAVGSSRFPEEIGLYGNAL